MGDTVEELNSAHLQERANRLDTAITKALASKVPAPPKAPKAGAPPMPRTPAGTFAPASKATSAPAADTTSLPTPAPADGASAGAAGSVGDQDEPTAEEPDTEVAAEAEPQDEPAEAEQTAFDPKELAALAKKKDLRAIEKKLGLEEGALGATNAEYAAYRRRVEEVESRAAAVEQAHVDNNQKLIDKFGPHYQLCEQAKKGDMRAYAGLIERTTGIPVGKFIALFSQNVQQMSPRELELERENQLFRSRGQMVTEQGQLETQKPVVDVAAATKKANEYLTAEAKDHPAFKLKGGLDDVRAKWLASWDKKTSSFKLTPQAAAAAVVAERKAQLEQEQWILSGKKPAKKPTTNAVPRTGSSETQPRGQLSDDPAIRRQQAIEIHSAQIRRQKAAERARAGG